MKKFGIFVTLFAALFVMVSAAGAQSLTYDSGFQVQNLSSTNTAAILISYYNQDGTNPIADVSDTIAAGKNKTYYPIHAAAGFNGSVVISSDQPVAAIVNVLANNFAYGASYGGFSAGAATVSLPLIMKNNSGYNTWFNVQNTGSADTNITVAYAGTACTETATIAPGAAKTFTQSSNSCLAATYVGAATVTSDGTVVATVMETGSTTLFAYNGFTGGSSSIVIPLVNANNAGYITGIQIQNVGGSSTDVTLSYTPASAGSACTETKTIAAGASSTFALSAFTGAGSCGAGAFVGSASVSANSNSQDLVGIVNQLNIAAHKGSSYNAFDPAAASGEVVMPLIMDRNSGYFTGFNVMNVGATDTVTCNFSNASGSVTANVTSGSLVNGAAFNHLQLNAIAANFVGSAVCTANGGGLFVGVVNELGGGSGDQLFTYEAFNN